MPAWIRTLLLAGIVSAVAAPAAATSVEQFTFMELCDHADLIIEGRVVASEAREDGLGGGIGTFIRIRVLDRLKGPDVGAELTLRFAGGTVDGLTLRIADMRMPAVGETGIYFVESLHEQQPHPLVGWSQGHFLELADAKTGLRRVYTPDGRAVLGIGSAPSTPEQRQVLPGTATASEILVAPAHDASRPAMVAADFKKLVRKSIAAPGAAK